MDYNQDTFEPPEGSMVATTTTVKTFQDCRRKWYFTKVMDLPEKDNPAFWIGSVLHLCVERWLMCENDIVPPPSDVPDQPVDEHGNFTTGSVLYGQDSGSRVQVFPPEWWKYQERNGTWREINENDQRLVKALVEHGIENGTLQRLAGGRVEEKFWLPLDLDSYAQGACKHWLTSLADYHSMSLMVLEDHKTTASLRWAVTEDTIAENLQLGIYALWMLWKTGFAQDGVHVAHNIFVKDRKSPRSKKVEGFIRRDSALETGRKLLLLVSDMLQLRDEAPDWQDVPPTESACDQYGGCPFRPICAGLRTPLEYTNDMNPPEMPKPQMASAPPALPQPVAAQVVDVPAAVAQAPAPVAQAPAPVAQAPAPVAQAPVLESARGKAPWANTACPVCTGLGVQEGGSACPMCMSTSPVQPDQCQWWWDQDGQFQVVAAQPQATPAPVAQPAPQPQPAPAPAPQPQPQPQAAPAPQPFQPQPEPVAEPVAESEPEAPSAPLNFRDALLNLDRDPNKKRGRPKRRFQMFVDCIPTATPTGTKFVLLSEVVRVLEDQYLVANGKEYWASDPFRRRDWVVFKAAEIAVALDKDFLLCDSGVYENKLLMGALEGYAELVVKGVGR